MKRRDLLGAAIGLTGVVQMRPAHATADELAAAVAAFAGGA